MRLLVLGLTPLITAAGAAAPAPGGEPVTVRFDTGEMPVLDPAPDLDGECPPISRYHAARREADRLGIRKLTQLPAADQYKAVYRKVDGCIAPVIVHFGVGGSR